MISVNITSICRSSTVPFRAPLVFFLTVFSVFMSAINIYGQDRVSLDEALPVFELFERRINRFQFDGETTKFSYADPNDREKITAMPLGRGPDAEKCVFRWSAVVEPHSGRYRVNMNSVSNWTAGTDPYASSRNSYSFDGITEREFTLSKSGSELPEIEQKKVSKRGKVDTEKKRRFLDKWGLSISTGEFPPYFRNVLLSEHLRSQQQAGKTVRIIKRNSDIWQIETMDPTTTRSTDLLTIDFDIRRGCILQIEHTEAGAPRPFIRTVFDIVETKPGLWVPWRKDKMELVDKNIWRTVLTNIKVNEPVADESIFRLTFPPGTRVEDQIEKKFYQVGSGSADEQINVQKFTVEQQLALEKQNQTPSSSRWWIWLAIGLGLTVCLAAGFCWRHYRNKAKVAGVLVVLLLGTSPASAAMLTSNGDWVVSHFPGEKIPISQCGWNVTFFTLEYFHYEKYRTKHIVTAMPPTEQGIRLSDMRDVLDGYGLHTFARQKVNCNELKRVVRPGTLAIVPFKISEDRHHYVVLIHHPERGLLLIDPPRSATPFKDDWAIQHLPDFDGVVLLVRGNGSPGKMQADVVECEPDSYDMGSIDLKGPTSSIPTEKSITLHNPSDRSIMVSEVKTSCGCVHCKWTGGLLAPGGTVTVPVTLLPNSWGVGRIERLFVFVFGDGSERQLKWIATGVVPEVAQQLEVKPDILRIDLTTIPQDTSRISREVDVLFGKVDVEKVVVSSSVPWITTSLVSIDERKARLHLRMDLSTDEIRAGNATGEITLTSRDDMAPVKLRVALQRPPAYTITPPVLLLRRKDMTSGQVLLKPVGPESDPRPSVKVISCPKNLYVEQGEQTKRSSVLQVRCGEQLPAGTHRVTCAVAFVQPGTNRNSTVPIEFVVVVE